jgi:hypothetical protein
VNSLSVEARIRRYIFLLSILVFASTLVELWLVDHTQEALQLVPFGLCAAGLLAVIAALLRPTPATITILRVVMLGIALGGIFGVGVHLLNNFQFEQEIRPNTSTWEALVAGLKGAAPMLAPGVLFFASLLSLTATYRHPTLTAQP